MSRQGTTSDEVIDGEYGEMNESGVSPGFLEEVVDRLAQGLHPEQIYLFGSQARD